MSDAGSLIFYHFCQFYLHITLFISMELLLIYSSASERRIKPTELKIVSNRPIPKCHSAISVI